MFILAAAVLIGCNAESHQQRTEQRDAPGVPSQPEGMAAEDAERTPTATGRPPLAKPDPIKRQQRSPVDQPRLR